VGPNRGPSYAESVGLGSGATTSTHYQRLGVNPSASTEEIRAAYRTLAGRLHPDRVVDGSLPERELAERRMREVNEAWQVLQDPGRRRAYDDSRLVGRRAPSTRAARPEATVPAMVADDDDLIDVAGEMGPVQAGLFRHGPWLVLLVVLGLIFVGTAYATSDKTGEAPVPAVRAGSCVDVVSGPTTTVVDCGGPHELRIVERVPDGGQCPAGTETRRLGTDGFLDCVRSG